MVSARPGSGVAFEDIQPWPDQVDGRGVAQEVAAAIDRHVALPPEGAVATALWVLLTHVHDSARVSPILAISSPLKRCGKTTLLLVIQRLVPRPVPSSSITPAALFRVIDAADPTLLVDEADSFLGAREELRGILNSGHTRGAAFVLRTVGEGSQAEVRQFGTWAPKAVAAIGRLPETIEDRSVRIQLERRKPGENVEPLVAGDAPSTSTVSSRAGAWTILTLPVGTRNVSTDSTTGAADNWQPLLAVADVLGGEWPGLARAAALRLSTFEPEDDDLGDPPPRRPPGSCSAGR